jgi:F-box/leucine-rich repeat protein 2/20
VTDTELSVVSRLKNRLKLDITCRNITVVSLATITSSCTSLICVSGGAPQLIGKRCSKLEELDCTDSDPNGEGTYWTDILNYSLPDGHKVDFEYFQCRVESSCQM